MQGQSYVGSIFASKKAGEPLCLDIMYEAKGEVVGCVEAIINEGKERLIRSGLCVSQQGFRGYCVGKQIKVFDNGKDTRFHEETHAWMSDIWRYSNDSFDEGWAYALEDYMFGERSTIEKRRAISLKICPFHVRAEKKALNGGLTPREENEITSIIDDSGVGYSGDKWASFLNVVNNFRYYGIFSDLLEFKGIDIARKRVKRAAELGKKRGVRKAVEYLLRVINSDGIFVSGDMNGVYGQIPIFNAKPVWEFNIFSGPGICVEDQTGDTKIEAWSLSDMPLHHLGQVIRSRRKELESLVDIKENFQRHLNFHLMTEL
ncbi:hypothetical protein ACFLZB_03585 [Nanoarchaeota archaeon]